jgi:D-amino-acid dehydrogenase
LCFPTTTPIARALEPEVQEGVSGRVVVVGGGVAGLAVALYLQRGGASVVVLEADRIGSGASAGNAGWICPAQAGPLPEPGLASYGLRSLIDRNSALYFAPSQLPCMLPWLRRFARHCRPEAHRAGVEALTRLGDRVFGMIDELQSMGFSPEIYRQGLLVAATERSPVQRFIDGLVPTATNLLRSDEGILAGDELHELEPALSRRVSAGAIVQEHWHVRPESFMASLAAHVRQRGVELRQHTPVVGFRTSAKRATHVETRAGAVEADAVVLATGARLGVDARKLFYRLPIAAGKGYSFSIRLATPPRRAILLVEPHVGCTPFSDGVRIAGTMEFSGINTRLDRRRVDAIVRGARPLLAGWEGEAAHAWTGMRPIAPDGLPLVDRLPGLANVFVAGAFSMLGMTLALPAGEALAEQMLTGERSAVLAPFRADRFARRSA